MTACWFCWLRYAEQERALSDDVLDVSTVNRVREDMERAEARRLQPFYIQSFFNAAMEASGGAWHRREGGRFEITRVPVAVQHARCGWF